MANISSVNRLLEARARFLISNVASSDIENAWAKLAAYSDAVLAWKPAVNISIAYGWMDLRLHVPVGPPS